MIGFDVAQLLSWSSDTIMNNLVKLFTFVLIIFTPNEANPKSVVDNRPLEILQCIDNR